MLGFRWWLKDPWEWFGSKFFSLAASLLKRWFAGALLGLLINAGAVGGALAAYALIALGGWLLDWSDLTQSNLLVQSAWVWVPIGWYVAGKELAAGKQDDLLAMFKSITSDPSISARD